MSEQARVKEYTNLYSMGLLPKVEGRYLTGPKPTSKLRIAIGKRSDFSMENARTRLNMQLRRIELSQRILQRSERICSNRSFCRTEPVEQISPLARLNTIHIKPIDISSPQRIKHIKKPISLIKPPSIGIQTSQNASISVQSLNQRSMGCPSSRSSVLKVKFGKKPLEQMQNNRTSPEGGQTIGQWAVNAQAERTQNHFELYYDEEKIRDDNLLEEQQEQKGMSHRHIAIKKIQRSKRQFLFRSSQFMQKQ